MRAHPLRPVLQRPPTSFPMRSPAGYLSLRSFLHYVVTWNQCTSLVCCGHISTSCHGGCLHHACHAAHSLILNQLSPTDSPAHSPAHLLASSLTHPQSALTNSLTSSLTSALTGQLTHSPAHAPTHVYPSTCSPRHHPHSLAHQAQQRRL
jgi:hypothetical protein